RQCKHRRGNDREEPRSTCESRTSEDERLEGHPLANKAVEWWQRGDGYCPEEKKPRSCWHSARKAAQLLHVAQVRARDHSASAEEQETLEARVVERVHQCCCERQRRERRGGALMAVREEHRGAG